MERQWIENEIHPASAGVDRALIDVHKERVHGPDGEHQARDLRLLGEQPYCRKTQARPGSTGLDRHDRQHLAETIIAATVL